MKIFICASKWFYDKIPPIADELEKAGHEITFPNSYEDPYFEEKIKENFPEKHSKVKAEFFRMQNEKIKNNDAIFVLNFEKKGIENYIGGATFLEMFKAWEYGKKIYLYNPIPEGSMEDEIRGFEPEVINGNLEKIIDFKQ